jgi:hypothetical protein
MLGLSGESELSFCTSPPIDVPWGFIEEVIFHHL